MTDQLTELESAPATTGSKSVEDMDVLVVDDEQDIATYLASVLEDAGMTVRIANDGQQALAMVEERAPDLVSLDLVMPGTSGVRVLHELRRRREWSRIPVIVVTAHARDPKVRGDLTDVLADSSLAGPSLYLEKPVTPRRYLESVCRVLDVEPKPDEPVDDDALRREAADLLQHADPEAVAEIVNRLRRDRRS
jgi:CheY-like chemotaxis protein